MTQRKGEVTKKQTDRDYPHQVAILIPPGGLGARSMAMHAWCDGRGVPYRTRADRRREPTPSDHTRFCFDDPAHADAFHAEFAGQRITIEHPPSGAKGPLRVTKRTTRSEQNFSALPS